MNQLVVTEVESLVALAEGLAADAAASRSNLGHEHVQKLFSIAARGGQLIARLYGEDSHYSKLFEDALGIEGFSALNSNHFRHVSNITGLLRAVEHDIKSGMLTNFRSLIQAEIFADFLEMAEHLLREGYKDAAAVILGAVLEDSLRKIASANNVTSMTSSGKQLTIDPLNSSLARKGVYGPLVQKQITSWANLRNDAAHGHFDKYDAAQVQQMLLFIQKFCADHLK